ncbi:hypothetical protein SAMN03080598_01990 [Algoriphagus boritolerans DSM 17298 = JCM 18970]|uniref:Uncharacterized protein n=2 Tax=Algoriphagus TaxID=246875 RepID=A0A1H5WAI6_9BACT|nr:hypothetical protein SAMN03080598_01990 [Algoriphagus boritolerans DSM 17298 = JCM 18970]
MENLVGGSFGTCFDEAAASSLAWLNYTDNPTARTFTAFALAEARLFECAMA